MIYSNTLQCVVNVCQVPPEHRVQLEQLEQLDRQVLLVLSDQLDPLVLLVFKELLEPLDRGELSDLLELLVFLDSLVQQADLVTLANKVLQDQKDRRDSLVQQVLLPFSRYS